MSNLIPHLRYLRYVVRHKWFVLLAGIPLGVPLVSLLLHDWDKFLPDEWFPYVASFYGKAGRTPEVKAAFNQAWLFHQHRNKHHWQYWLLTFDDGGTRALEMPDSDRREMLADWIGAGKAQGNPDTAAWFRQKGPTMVLALDTQLWIEQQVGVKIMVAA